MKLVRRAKRGDVDAFAELYAGIYKDMYRFALYTLRNTSDAEDAVSDAVTDAFASIRKQMCIRDRDRFVYLPEMPYRKVDLDKVARNVLSQAQFEQDGGEGAVASWRNTVTVENVHPNTTVSFRMNNLSGSTAELKLYAYGADGTLAEVSNELWSITDEAGSAVDKLCLLYTSRCV